MIKTLNGTVAQMTEWFSCLVSARAELWDQAELTYVYWFPEIQNIQSLYYRNLRSSVNGTDMKLDRSMFIRSYGHRLSYSKPLIQSLNNILWYYKPYCSAKDVRLDGSYGTTLTNNVWNNVIYTQSVLVYKPTHHSAAKVLPAYNYVVGKTIKELKGLRSPSFYNDAHFKEVNSGAG
jgi:hypothetical protein